MGRERIQKSHRRVEAVKNGFRSGLEQDMAQILDEMKLKYEYESEKLLYTVTTKKAGLSCVHCGSDSFKETKEYNPDFTLVKSKLIIETKGIFTARDRKKMIAVVRDNPNRNILMVFQNSNMKISKSSRYTYKTWCTKVGMLGVDMKQVKDMLTGMLQIKKKLSYINEKQKHIANGRKD